MLSKISPFSSVLVFHFLRQIPRAALQGGFPATPPLRVAERWPGLQDSRDVHQCNQAVSLRGVVQKRRLLSA